jgi:hypothetical protein
MEQRPKLLIVAESSVGELYYAILETCDYNIRVFSYDELAFGDHMEEALKEVSSFHPRVVVLHYEGANTDAPMVRLRRERGKADRPLMLMVAPSDAWCKDADVCISSPVAVEVLRREVEELLRLASSR